jgi:glycosyltransferase involved in cell wall biosynthesis
MAIETTTTTLPAIEPAAAPATSRQPGPRNLRRLAAVVQIRSVLGCYIALLRLGRRLGRSRRPIPAAGADILITGTFHSDNWVRSHLKPLAASKECARLRIVATNPVPAVDKVVAIYPPRWLRRTIGDVPARLLVFILVAIRTRPDVVGAFHMLINGLVTALVGRWIGARSMYFCVGGPVEVLDGGIHGENRYFCRLQTPDPLVERWLLEATAACDLIITMGTRAKTFFRERGITSACHVVAGGIDASTFGSARAAATDLPEFDAVLVARLVPIKAIDIFVRAIAELARTRPQVKAAIVGDGPLRAPLEQLARDLGIADRITFAGQQRDVQHWLRRSRIFVLTSHSEGLALSLMEAMTCGLPGVVSHVGDLSDLVTHGLNGFLVPEREPQAFARRLAELLDDRLRYAAFADAARLAAARYESAETTRLWDRVLRSDAPHEAPA